MLNGGYVLALRKDKADQHFPWILPQDSNAAPVFAGKV